MAKSIETFEFHDMDQYMEVAAETMDVLGIQLQPGKLHMQNQVLQLDNITVTHYASNRKMLQYLTIPAQHVLFVLTPATVNGCKWGGIEVPCNSLAILHPGDEHQALIPDNWSSIEFLISDDTIAQEVLLSETLWQQTLQPQHALFTRQAVRIRSLFQKLRKHFQKATLLNQLTTDTNEESRLKNQIFDALRMILIESENNRFQNTPINRSRRYKTLSRSLEFIEVNLEQQLSIEQICDQIGTTPRTLQLTFQELLGVSPSQYLSSRKLQAIQQGMFNSQDVTIPIYQHAQKYGMLHAGRFSQQYKRMFTESPHEAMKRRHAISFG